MPNNPQSPQKSDITTLITAFSTASGFQKSNRFRINIIPPTAIPGGILITPTAFTVFASNIQTPSQSIIFYEDTMSPSGPPISIPLRRNYDDRYIIEFIIDKKWNIRSFFDSWISALFLNTGTNTTNNNSTRVQYFTDIVGTLEIEALDQNDNVVKTITLYDAYPKQIIPTQFSNDTPNQYLTLIVDMMYRYYTIT
jgi:hypothetical protein